MIKDVGYHDSFELRNSCLGVSPQGHAQGDGPSLRNFSAEKYQAPRKKYPNRKDFVMHSNFLS
jgi:hypothetical protein